MTFDTPEPISVTVDVVVGDVRITAADRRDTVVDVQPSDPASREDVKAAEQTRVECVSGHLLVKAPKLRTWSIRSHGGSIDVTIALPAGSDMHGDRAAQVVRRLPHDDRGHGGRDRERAARRRPSSASRAAQATSAWRGPPATPTSPAARATCASVSSTAAR